MPIRHLDTEPQRLLADLATKVCQELEAGELDKVEHARRAEVFELIDKADSQCRVTAADSFRQFKPKFAEIKKQRADLDARCQHAQEAIEQALLTNADPALHEHKLSQLRTEIQALDERRATLLKMVRAEQKRQEVQVRDKLLARRLAIRDAEKAAYWRQWEIAWKALSYPFAQALAHGSVHGSAVVMANEDRCMQDARKMLEEVVAGVTGDKATHSLPPVIGTMLSGFRGGVKATPVPV